MDEMQNQPECFQTIRAMLGEDDTPAIRPQASAQPHHQPSIHLILHDIRRVNSALLSHLPAQLGLPTTGPPEYLVEGDPGCVGPDILPPKGAWEVAETIGLFRNLAAMFERAKEKVADQVSPFPDMANLPDNEG